MLLQPDSGGEGMAGDTGRVVDPGSAEGRERVARVFRYSVVGRCVNSVTHDVNNTLGAIMAYAELLGMEPNLSGEGQRMTQEIVSGVRRCAGLIHTLTSVARPERTVATLADPAEAVEAALAVRAYDLKMANVEVLADLPKNALNLMLDLPRFEVAILALTANALESLAEHEGTKQLRVQARVEEGCFVCTMHDSGMPVDESVAAQMFEPYFTTKDHQHPGLGLPLARACAEVHEGKLTYAPESGFVLSLPTANSLMERYNSPA